MTRRILAPFVDQARREVRPDAELIRLRQQVSEQEAQIRAYQFELKRLEQEHTELVTILAQYDKEIYQLKAVTGGGGSASGELSVGGGVGGGMSTGGGGDLSSSIEMTRPLLVAEEPHGKAGPATDEPQSLFMVQPPAGQHEPPRATTSYTAAMHGLTGQPPFQPAVGAPNNHHHCPHHSSTPACRPPRCRGPRSGPPR